MMVQRIVEFRAELNVHLFPDVEVLIHSKVKVIENRLHML